MVNQIGATCQSKGFAALSQSFCFQVATKIGLNPRFTTNHPNRPKGCYRRGDRVYFGTHPNAGGAQSDRKPICSTGSTEYGWLYENGATCGSMARTMLSKQECWDVAEEQGLVKGFATSHPFRPKGCYRRGYKVFFGEWAASTGAQASSGRHPICGPAYGTQYLRKGICNGQWHQIDTSSSVSNAIQCLAKCGGIANYFSVRDVQNCAPATACKCCTTLGPHGSSSWKQFRIIYPNRRLEDEGAGSLPAPLDQTEEVEHDE